MKEYPVHRQEKWRNEKESILQEKEWISISTFLLFLTRKSRIVSKEYLLEIEEIYNSYRMAVALFWWMIDIKIEFYLKYSSTSSICK